MAAVACRAASSLPASRTALVISSTNSGMLSVRSMMSWRTLAGSALLPTTPSMIAVNITFPQPIDGDECHIRSPHPRWLKVGPECHDQQYPKAANPVDDPTKHFKARGVGPMRVFEDHEHRILPSHSANSVGSLSIFPDAKSFAKTKMPRPSRSRSSPLFFSWRMIPYAAAATVWIANSSSPRKVILIAASS